MLLGPELDDSQGETEPLRVRYEVEDLAGCSITIETPDALRIHVLCHVVLQQERLVLWDGVVADHPGHGEVHLQAPVLHLDDRDVGLGELTELSHFFLRSRFK